MLNSDNTNRDYARNIVEINKSELHMNQLLIFVIPLTSLKELTTMKLLIKYLLFIFLWYKIKYLFFSIIIE